MNPEKSPRKSKAEEAEMRILCQITIGCALLTAFSLGLMAAEEKNKLGLPNPPQADVPYLIHASNLVETEKAAATEETRDNQSIYCVPGASSPARTPLTGPEFLFLADKLDPSSFELFAMQANKGRREVLVRKKKKIMAQSLIVTVWPVESGLYRIRVDDRLQAGEYCLTPKGSNDAFCFAVF
jgi:hypothetical protein